MGKAQVTRKRVMSSVFGGAVGAIFMVGGGSVPALAQAASPTETCAALSRLTLDAVEIVSVRDQPAGMPVEGARMPGMDGNPGTGAAVAGLPAFCRVVGVIRPVSGSEIRFEVWIPSTAWDGRFYGVGTGGFAGSIDYLTLGLALKAGQASVATDTGHSSSAQESAWAKGHPEKVRDYGWRAVHLSTVAAKKIVAAYFGRAPDHSYFVGCSGGGRQGLIEASRFPEDYDGIVAGAPAAIFTDLAMSMTNAIQAQLPPGAAIRTSQAPFLQSEVLNQCDATDDQVDGLVADPRQCKFDVAKLACGAAASKECFSPQQITALTKIYSGPLNASGRQIVHSFLASGSESGTPSPLLGWQGYLLTPVGGPPRNESLAGGLLGNLVQKPFATTATFDFSKDPAKLKAALGSDLDAKPDLRRFFNRGGRVIFWHGWADAAIPPEATIDFYNATQRSSGPKAKSSSRLFMVPGTQHCLGGTGPNSFGQMNAPQPGETPETSMVAALQAWVEKGRTPQTLIGRRGFGGFMGMPVAKPERQRLLCAYPSVAKLRSGANPDVAAGYACEAPTKTAI